MRRLIVEATQDELSKVIVRPLLKEIKSFQVVSFLRVDPMETVMISKVELMDPNLKFQDLFGGDRSYKIQLIERDRRGVALCYIKVVGRKNTSSRSSLVSTGFLSTPYEIKDGKARMTYLGNSRQLKAFLHLFEELKINYKILSLGDAKFSLNSPLSRLTDKQMRVLTAAYNLGYYDIPRRTNSDELAGKLKMRNATLVMHRRRAERRLLDELFSGYGDAAT